MNIACLALALSVVTATASHAIELTVHTPDGLGLAGTLHVPAADRYPVVIFTHGSGPDVRQATAYTRWVDPFLERGIGVLAFDKRGCGESEGVYVEAPDLEVPAGDVLAWVELLSQRPEVTELGVMGWSQGGWVGPLAASQDERLRFVVSISGPAVSPMEQNIHDKTNQCAASGATPEQVAAFERTIRLVWGYIATGDGEQPAQAAWDAVSEEAWFKRAYHGPPMMDRDPLLAHPSMTQYVAHATYDPMPVLERLQVPMLAIFGGADSIVPVDASIANLRRAFGKSGNPALTVLRVEGADHGLRLGDGRMAPGYPDEVAQWVVEMREGKL